MKFYQNLLSLAALASVSSIFISPASALPLFTPALDTVLPALNSGGTNQIHFHPLALTSGDVNHDTVGDIGLLINLIDNAYPDASGSVMLNSWYGSLVGSFTNGTGSSGYDYHGIIGVDVDQNGITDFCSATGRNNGVVIFNMTIPDYFTTTHYLTGSNSDSLAAGDFDKDGLPDLVTANFGDNNVSVLINNTRGTFRSAVNYPVDLNPIAIATGDVDGDGNLDVITSNERAGTVSVLLGVGDGSFQTKIDTSLGFSSASIVSQDFNHDGKADLALTNTAENTVSVLMSRGDGTFSPKIDYQVGIAPVGLVSGDLNGDAKPDLAAANKDNNSVSIWLGNQDGTFRDRQDYHVGQQPMSLAIGDFNGDGQPDLATANYIGESISLLRHPSKGDLNADSEVKVFDVIIALQDFLGLRTPSSDEIALGDIRPSQGDGKIGADDVNWLLRRIVN